MSGACNVACVPPLIAGTCDIVQSMTNCKASVLEREIEAFDAQRGKSEHEAYYRRRKSAEYDGDLPRHAKPRRVHGRVGADCHDGGVTEMELAGPADNEVEPQRCRRPYQPRQNETAEIEGVKIKRRQHRKYEKDADHEPVSRNREQRAVSAVVGVEYPGLTEQHHILSISWRPNRPCGRTKIVRISIAASTSSRLAPPTIGSK